LPLGWQDLRLSAFDAGSSRRSVWAAEEADESKGWLQALLGANMASRAELQALIQEADELVRIFTASIALPIFLDRRLD